MPRLSAGFRFLSSEVRGLQAAVYVLALFALLSSFLALVRDRLLASYFGAGIELDIYYAAFRVPDLIFVSLGALVSVYMLIPELSRRDHASQRKYIDTVFVGFSIFSVIISAIAAVLAPFFLARLFPEFVDAGHLTILVALTRIMLLQPILLGLSNILAAITQTRRRYTLYAASPLFYNLGIILGIIVLYPIWGLAGLAWGVVVGALLHAAIQLPSVMGDGFFNSVPRLWMPRELLRTVSISVPRALALSMNQITLIGLTALAGLLATGSIAVMTFANNLHAVPLAIIGASYSVAAFPTLSLAFSSGRTAEFIHHIATAARHILFWSLPATALIIVLRAHIVRAVLGSGAFDWSDTRLTAAAFAIFSISLVFQAFLLLLVRGYYAAGRTFVPLALSAGIAALTITLGWSLLHVFEKPAVLFFTEALFRVEDIAGSDVLALALAYTFAAVVGTIALTIHFEHRFRGFFSEIKRTMAQGLVAAFAAGIAAYAMLWALGPLTVTPTLLSVLLRGFTAGAFGIIVSSLTYSLLKNREYIETVAAVRGRLWRESVEEKKAVAIVASSEETPPL